MALCSSLSPHSISIEFRSGYQQKYLAISKSDLFLGESLEEHFFGYEVGSIFALLAIVKLDFVDFAWVKDELPKLPLPRRLSCLYFCS